MLGVSSSIEEDDKLSINPIKWFFFFSVTTGLWSIGDSEDTGSIKAAGAVGVIWLSGGTIGAAEKIGGEVGMV